MNYHLQSLSKKGKRRKRLVLIIIAIPVLALIVFFNVSPPSRTPLLLHYISQPLWRVKLGVEVSFKDSLGILKSKSQLIQKNKDMRFEVQNNRLKLEERELLLKENERLKLLFSRSNSENLVLAKVLTKPSQSAYDTFVVDVGKDDGVSPGNVVLAGSLLSVGEVTKVYSSTSVVSLLSSPGIETRVLVGHELVPAVAFGMGGGNFEVKIPRSVSLDKGSHIVLPGLESRYIGTIKEIVFESSNPFKKLLIISPVNPFHLNDLLIDIS